MSPAHAHPEVHEPPAHPGSMPGGEATQMPMESAQPAAVGVQMEHMAPTWPHFANMVVGLWLTTSIFALGYGSTALQASDAVSGVLIIILSILSLSHRPWLKLWAPWTNSLVGLCWSSYCFFFFGRGLSSTLTTRWSARW